MTDTNGTCLSTKTKLDIKVNSDTEEGEEGEEEEEEAITCDLEEVSDDIPASLLSYFESCRSRAAMCEKLILEDLEDFPASHRSEWAQGAELHPRKQPMQVFSETEKEGDQTDASLFLRLTGAQDASCCQSVSLCGSSEDEDVEGEVKICDSEAKREKQQQEEMQSAEQRRRREQEFQEELRRIMETEKLHQIELEEMRKKAEEKLEQELLLQQELIGDLKKRVERERRRIEEEEEERKIREEERRRKEKEEERKRVEMRLNEEEDRRKREEVQKKQEEQKKKQMVLMRLKEEEEEERRTREEEEERKRVEMRLKEEEDRRKEEEEKRKVVEMKLKEEENRIKEKEKIEKEEEKRRTIEKRLREEEDMRQKKDEEKRREQEEEMKKRSEMSLKEENRRKKETEEKRKGLETEKKKEEEMMKKEKERRIKETQVREVKRQVGEEEENKMESQKLKGEERKMKDEESMMQVPERKTMGKKENGELKLSEELKKLRKEEVREGKEESEKERGIEGKAEEEVKGKENESGLIESAMETESKTRDELGKTNEVEMKIRIDLEEDEKVKKEEVEEEEEVMTALMRENGMQLMGSEETRKKGEERSQSSAKEEEEEMEGNEKEGGNKCKEDRRVAHERKTEEGEEKQGELRKLHKVQEIGGIAKVENVDREERAMEEGRPSSPSPIEAAAVGATAEPLSERLPEHTEDKRLCWMKECVSWSTLSHHNRRTHGGSARGQRGGKRTPETAQLPPLCPHALLRATGWKSLQEVTVLTLEELPGCSLSTLVHCPRLQSLTLRRCGLRAVEGISSLNQLCYIDLQENDISYIDCENMIELRVLLLARNKLTSIHGLSGAENLGVLDLSHNFITRIAGLESMRSLQKLRVDHNQLISTKGLRDVCTLLHLGCSHNHLVRVEGLENNALLRTLDLSANSLTEPPGLSNHVLLQELHLDDNSISSLRGLAACWCPLMQHLSVGHNRITELPPMSDFVSLENLDLQFNCLSELRNVCENLEGCRSLQEVRLSGNPLQQESGWRSTLQKAMPRLRDVDGQQTEPRLPPTAASPVAPATYSFRSFCRAQLEQTRDLQRRHSSELSSASFPFDAVKSFCRHLTETLQLAEDQRFAHEYGDTTVPGLRPAEQTTPERRPVGVAEKLADHPKVQESTNEALAVIQSRDDSECSLLSFEVVPVAERSFDTVGEGQELKTRAKVSLDIEDSPVDLKNAAAVVIQQRWRTYRQKCRNVPAPPVGEKGGEGGEAVGGRPESGTSCTVRRASSESYAAAVIQAFWRGCALRKKLASALAAVTWPDAAEDDTFEEVDADEFAFDEASLDKQWTLTLSTEQPIRLYPRSEPPLFSKLPETGIDPPQYTRQVGNPKQAWAAHGDSATQRTSAWSSERNKSPASPSVLSGLSRRSEEILEEWGFTDSHTALLMLKRARKMKVTNKPQRQQRDPSARQAPIGNNDHQTGPAEAPSRPAPRNRSFVKVGEARLGLQRVEMTQRGKQGRAQQRLYTDGLLESEHFLPEINSSILNGGRVQLVQPLRVTSEQFAPGLGAMRTLAGLFEVEKSQADPAYADHLHHVSGLGANSSSSSSRDLAARLCKGSSHPHRSSSGHARQDIPSQERGMSAPATKERVLVRDRHGRLKWDMMNK